MSNTRLTLVFLLATLATSLQAETINCTPITTLPATIRAQGIYCLTGKLTFTQTSGAAITITAKNVTLDLNGWMLDGHKAGTGTFAYGIYSIANNVTVKNGIVSGFFQGIYLTGTEAIVRDIRADQNTAIGIYVSGLDVLVERNQVINTGGSTAGADVSAFGIEADGSDSTVNDNMVSGLTATGYGNEFGIIVYGSHSTIRDNVISNTILPVGGGSSTGIDSRNQSIILNNAVSNFMYGIAINNGGIYSYNTANNCTNNFVGGTAGAGNSP